MSSKIIHSSTIAYRITDKEIVCKAREKEITIKKVD